MYKIDSFTNKPKEPVRHVYLMEYMLTLSNTTQVDIDLNSTTVRTTSKVCGDQQSYSRKI